MLPAIVREDQLVDANSKLHMSEAVLTLAGPGAAGVLIQLVTAPKAIIVDVVSFLVSAFSLGGIAAAEPKPEKR
nr:MFS transporter [Chloroflexia bacterium]